MTVLCGGGTSRAKPGVPEVVLLTGTAISDLLMLAGIRWPVAFAIGLGSQQFDIEDFCSTDPPANPNFTALDALALAQFTDLEATRAAQSKILDIVKIAAWHVFCECSSVATPSIPTAITQPPEGLPQGPFVQPTNQPCYVRSVEHDFPLMPAPPAWPNESKVTRLFFPNYSYVNVVPPSSSGTTEAAVFGTGVFDRSRITLEYIGTGPNWRPNLYFYFFNSGGAIQFAYSVNNAQVHDSSVGGTEVRYFQSNWEVWPLATAYSVAVMAGDSGPDASLCRATIELGCVGQNVGGATGGCAPDPTLRAVVDQILQLVTLIQRQHVPFSLLPGTTHSGLSGGGTIAVQGLAAVRVLVSSRPAHTGLTEGNPDRLHDIGVISSGTPDGWDNTAWITSDAFLFRVSPDVTTIGYQLEPGVVVSIEEMKREP